MNLVGEVAVVGQQQQSAGVEVQAADREDAAVAFGDEVVHALAALRVARGDDHDVLGLVES